MELGYGKVELFGGAIEADFPLTALSNADLLLVPDNQEVYVESVTQATLILEILEYSNVPDSEAIHYLFTDLADSNEAYGPDHSQIYTILPVAAEEAPFLSSDWPKFICKGKQHIISEKQADAPRKAVLIYLFLVRIPTVSSDLLLSISLPEETSSDHEVGIVEGLLRQFIGSLCIKNMTLFGVDNSN